MSTIKTKAALLSGAPLNAARESRVFGRTSANDSLTGCVVTHPAVGSTLNYSANSTCWDGREHPYPVTAGTLFRSVIPEVEPNDQYGSSLAAGDFNGDGCDDLAIGAPLEILDTILHAGVVIVVQGSPSGIEQETARLWHLDVPGLRGKVRVRLASESTAFLHQGILADSVLEAGDGLGRSLAAGDFNWDGRLDFVVGVPDEDVGSVRNAGAIHVVYSPGFASKVITQ